MKTIDMEHILNLYRKCNVDGNGGGVIRNTLNLGTLSNTLNLGSAYANTGKSDTVLNNNTASINKMQL